MFKNTGHSSQDIGSDPSTHVAALTLNSGSRGSSTLYWSQWALHAHDFKFCNPGNLNFFLCQDFPNNHESIQSTVNR